MAEVIPVFKTGDILDKSNYRPISLLPAISKIYERVIFDRLSAYLEPMLSKILCGFRSKHNTQHALLYLLKAWQQCLNKSGLVGTILMDLSNFMFSMIQNARVFNARLIILM